MSTAAPTYTPLDAIRTALIAIRARGYFQPTTRQWEKEIPTALDVRNRLEGGAPYEPGDHRRFAEAAAAIPLEHAATAHAWCATPPPGADGYRLNLSRAVSRPTLRDQDIALIVSGAYAWTQAQKRAARADEQAADAAASRHIGEEGERIKVTAAVVVIIDQGERTYGYRTQTKRLVKLRAECGAILAWSTTTSNPPRPGATVELTGTVTSHTTYRDTATTFLTRCRWTLAEQAAIHPDGPHR